MTSINAMFACKKLVFDVLCKIANALAQIAYAQTFAIFLII